MSKYRITVEGKTYEMDVELIGSNGAPVQPVKVRVHPLYPHLLQQLPRQLQSLLQYLQVP